MIYHHTFSFIFVNRNLTRLVSNHWFNTTSSMHIHILLEMNTFLGIYWAVWVVRDMSVCLWVCVDETWQTIEGLCMAGSLLAHFTKKTSAAVLVTLFGCTLKLLAFWQNQVLFFPRLYIPPSICTVNVSVSLITANVRKYDSIPDLMPCASYAEDLFLLQ